MKAVSAYLIAIVLIGSIAGVVITYQATGVTSISVVTVDGARWQDGPFIGGINTTGTAAYGQTMNITTTMPNDLIIGEVWSYGHYQYGGGGSCGSTNSCPFNATVPNVARATMIGNTTVQGGFRVPISPILVDNSTSICSMEPFANRFGFAHVRYVAFSNAPGKFTWLASTSYGFTAFLVALHIGSGINMIPTGVSQMICKPLYLISPSVCCTNVPGGTSFNITGPPPISFTNPLGQPLLSVGGLLSGDITTTSCTRAVPGNSNTHVAIADSITLQAGPYNGGDAVSYSAGSQNPVTNFVLCPNAGWAFYANTFVPSGIGLHITGLFQPVQPQTAEARRLYG
jgi:hypothetical protein